MRVVPFEPSQLPQLLDLVNLHLAAVLPGWALSGTFLAEHLERDRTEPITDPWVEERVTLYAFDAGRLLAAAHLLRYGEGPEVGDGLKGAGEIDWFVSLPDRHDAAAELLKTVRERLATWGVGQDIHVARRPPHRADDRGSRRLAARREGPPRHRSPARR